LVSSAPGNKAQAIPGVRLILLVVACTFYAQVLVFITMPVAAMDAGIDALAVGFLLALPGATSLLIDMPVASLSDATGRRRFLAFGGACLSVAGFVLAGASTEIVRWSIGVLITGASMALLVSPSLAFLTEANLPAAQSRVQGLNGSIQAAASIAAALVAGIALGAGAPHLAFATVSASGVVIMLSALFIRDTADRTGSLAIRIAIDGYRRGMVTLHRPRVAQATLLAVTYGVLFLVVGNGFMPTFAISLAVPPALVGVLLGTRTVVVMLSSPWFPQIVGRFGLVRLMEVTTLLGAVGLALVPLAAALPLILIPSVLLQGIGIAFSAAAANVWIAGSTPTNSRALAIAASNLGSRLALLLASPLLGLISGAAPPAPFVVGAGVVAILARLIRRVAAFEPADSQLATAR
jgi:MFS family permease